MYALGNLASTLMGVTYLPWQPWQLIHMAANPHKRKQQAYRKRETTCTPAPALGRKAQQHAAPGAASARHCSGCRRTVPSRQADTSPSGHTARPVITAAARPPLSASPNRPLAARAVGKAFALGVQYRHYQGDRR